MDSHLLTLHAEPLILMEAAQIPSSMTHEAVVAQTEWVLFKKSAIHGLGGYARKLIPQDTYIIEYVGEKIDKVESARRCEADNHFIFAYDETHDLDGNVDWNPARWINHSCEPNCETIDDEGHMWVAALRDIQPGEELTFNYNYDLEDYKAHPCRCGSGKCVGYMVAEEYFDHLRRQQDLAREAQSETPTSAPPPA
jgi:hypothetical protein